MARTDTLGHFLTDVADAIRTKTGNADPITASTFDTEIGSIPSGGDLSEYFDNELNQNLGIYNARSLIKKFPGEIDIIAMPSNDMRQIFYGFVGLIEAPYINTRNATNFSQMFGGCNNLVTIPQYDLSSATDLSMMFNACYSLSDESLNNILIMCANATSYTGQKTLIALAIGGSYYPQSRIEALPNYQDFINAGWTTGY